MVKFQSLFNYHFWCEKTFFSPVRIAKAELDAGEMSVRVSQLIREAQSLLKITGELRQMAVLSDLPAAAAEVAEKTASCRQKELTIANRIDAVKQEMANELFLLEEEFYYSSPLQ